MNMKSNLRQSILNVIICCFSLRSASALQGGGYLKVSDVHFFAMHCRSSNDVQWYPDISCAVQGYVKVRTNAESPLPVRWCAIVQLCNCAHCADVQWCRSSNDAQRCAVRWNCTVDHPEHNMLIWCRWTLNSNSFTLFGNCFKIDLILVQNWFQRVRKKTDRQKTRFNSIVYWFLDIILYSSVILYRWVLF